MAMIVTMRNKKTGKVQDMYTADARDLLSNPATKNDWEHVGTAPRGTKLADPKIREAEGGPGTLSATEEAQRQAADSLEGARGGRPQEPAQASPTGGAPVAEPALAPTPADPLVTPTPAEPPKNEPDLAAPASTEPAPSPAPAPKDEPKKGSGKK